MKVLLAIVFAIFCVAFSQPAMAGLDLENQEEVRIQDLDLDRDGRIQRKEVAEYMFYYFDRDGNESLTSGEYSADRPISVIPYEGEDITFIDLDNDGTDDGVNYTLETFLPVVMIGEYDPQEGKIEARDFVDSSFLRLDTDKSKAIEQREWQKAYEKAAVKKPNQAPKAAAQERYSR